MRVLVTGADGFIGRRLVKRFVDEGWLVTAQVRPGRTAGFDRSAIEVAEVELAELRKLADLPSRVQLVVHLAWAGVAPESRNVAEVQLANLDASLASVDVAAALGATRVLCPGSMSEFALHNGPVYGSEAPSPVDFYSAAKVAARTLMGVRCAQLGIGLVWALVTSVFGPGRQDNNVLTYTMRELLVGATPKYTGLEQVWDYLYIDDLVEALWLLALRGRPGRCYPVGSGTVRPLSSYVREVRDAISPDADLMIGALPYRSSRLDSSIPVLDALVEDTGFEPRVTFAAGVKATVRWMQESSGRLGVE
jgi:nucleoside-diphosphate-sugar epimerase